MSDWKNKEGTFYTINEVAAFLKRSHGTVRLMIKRGEIGHHVFPINSIRISAAQLANFYKKTKSEKNEKEQKDD